MDGWTAALPIGILFFIGTLLGATRKRAGKALAQRQFPALGERLGLSFEPPRYSAWVGQLRGTFDGYRVLVQPDEKARIVVFLESEPQVQMRSYEHFKRVPENSTTFSLGSRRLDGWVKNRYCAWGKEDVFGQSPELRRRIAALEAWKLRISQFTVDPQRVELVLDYGSPPFIPTADVELLLPELTQLARVVEACAGSSATG